MAAAHADHVVAVDGDEVTIERLYRSLRGDGGADARILPLVMDLADPSPGIGWRNRERAGFGDRGGPDLVLALALVHHLALTNGVPLDEVVDWLASFGGDVVVEFVDRTDPMSQRLLANKPDGTHDAYTRARLRGRSCPALLGPIPRGAPRRHPHPLPPHPPA